MSVLPAAEDPLCEKMKKFDRFRRFEGTFLLWALQTVCSFEEKSTEVVLKLHVLPPGGEHRYDWDLCGICELLCRFARGAVSSVLVKTLP